MDINIFENNSLLSLSENSDNGNNIFDVIKKIGGNYGKNNNPNEYKNNNMTTTKNNLSTTDNDENIFEALKNKNSKMKKNRNKSESSTDSEFITTDDNENIFENLKNTKINGNQIEHDDKLHTTDADDNEIFIKAIKNNNKHSNMSESENREDNETDMNDSEKIQDTIVELMKKKYSHPEPSDPNIQYKLYKKREYHHNKIPPRPTITENTEYSVIKNYRDSTCARQFTLHEHQGMLSNFINPDTPYRGILIFHGLGTGKCVHKNTNVYINDRYERIVDIWEKYKTEVEYDDDNGEWTKPMTNLYVLSYDEKLKKIERKKVVRIYRERINSRLREITLETGKIINITDMHRLLTENGWNNVLMVEDKVCTIDNTDNKNVVYDKVCNIKYVHYDDYVYDLEIRDTHNYIADDIICHNTCVGVAIAEKFKNIVQKYDTKIYILVPGPIIKDSWKQHLLKCTGETYKKYQDKYAYIEDDEKNRQNKQAIAQALQYYRIMSYRSFYRRVLGEKIVDSRVTKGDKKATVYRKTKDGEFERDIAIDRIYNLNNTVIIVDEAHNLTGNYYGDALRKIIDESVNLKVVLMTATPMKNVGSDIIELINFLRPKNFPMARDKIFNQHKNYMMDFKSGGLDYFKNMINGYVSHVRGSDPLTFARRVDKGVIPKGLFFTNVTRCVMLDFQRDIYDTTIKDLDDALDRASEAVANMAFPGLSNDRKKIVGYYGINGLNIIRDQLKINSELLNEKIGEKFFGGDKSNNFLYISNNGKSVTGKIFKLPYLKYFSIKFYKAMKKLGRLVVGKKGARTAFIYSNLVKIGIELFQEVLIQNGYLEYQEDASNYYIGNDTICYYCGKIYSEHGKMFKPRSSNEQSGGQNNKTDKKIEKVSDTSTEYDENEAKDGTIIPHKFYPATFLTITGKGSEETAEDISSDKKRILDNVFNNISNKDGKFIKFILGSKVMTEGINLHNVKEVHILDVYYNLGKVDQIVGRSIRWCSHYRIMDENNVYPSVNVYKYVVSLDKSGESGLSSEEDLYRKAEHKYMLIKKIERAMKERAFDCPLNRYGNMFDEEIEKYKNCDMQSELKCPVICDYTKCDYICDDQKLNYEYYDPERKIYKMVDKDDLDLTTFTSGLAETEIEYAKNKIKEMYITEPVFTLKDIVEYVKNSYDEEKRKLFDEFFVFKALDILTPTAENDFNNFKDTIIDKNNTQGYLIYRDKYYIFQPFNQNEDVPLYYRINITGNINYELSLYNYLKHSEKYKNMKIEKGESPTKTKIIRDDNVYNFEDTHEYYDTKEEFDFVGIIDKELSRRKEKRADEIKDVFKIRPRLPKILDKKRGTGIPSLKGAVCETSKTKKYLEKIANKIGANVKVGETRGNICKAIEKAMLDLEKYSTDKDKNKFTYVRIPSNHPNYPFPYNLEDRRNHIVNKIKSTIKYKTKIDIKNVPIKTGINKGKLNYIIKIKNTPEIKEYSDFLKKINAVLEKDEWTITID